MNDKSVTQKTVKNFSINGNLVYRQISIEDVVGCPDDYEIVWQPAIDIPIDNN